VAREAGVYPPHLTLTPCTVHRELGDETWQIGDVTIRSLPTAGHAAGHLCFVADFRDGLRAAFTGDLVFTRGRVAILGTPDTDLRALKESIASVASTAPTALFPGHGSVALTAAGEHLKVALDAFALGALPSPLLP
jgi:glyoxylase-like metal-dependent hydrolase (beta-lactamase superfamily II)